VILRIVVRGMFVDAENKMWYAAHIIMYLRFQDGLQDKHPVWEEIYIIQANSSDDAFREADRIGAFNQSADIGSHTYENRPVRWEYAGVRRMAECIDFEDGPPQSGKEVSYIYYFLEDAESINSMMNKQSVRLVLDGEDIT